MNNLCHVHIVPGIINAFVLYYILKLNDKTTASENLDPLGLLVRVVSKFFGSYFGA